MINKQLNIQKIKFKFLIYNGYQKKYKYVRKVEYKKLKLKYNLTKKKLLKFFWKYNYLNDNFWIFFLRLNINNLKKKIKQLYKYIDIYFFYNLQYIIILKPIFIKKIKQKLIYIQYFFKKFKNINIKTKSNKITYHLLLEFFLSK